MLLRQFIYIDNGHQKYASVCKKYAYYSMQICKKSSERLLLNATSQADELEKSNLWRCSLNEPCPKECCCDWREGKEDLRRASEPGSVYMFSFPNSPNDSATSPTILRAKLF